MSSVTFLGASGGCGTTTLAALSVLMLAEHTSRVPTAVAEDAAAFDARLGALPSGIRGSGDELVDGGRFSTGKAAAALSQGRLVIVGADTPQGTAALGRALADIAARFGGAGAERTTPVLCAAFGRPSASASDASRIRIPFDRRLAPPAALSDALPAFRGRAIRSLQQQWLPELRAVYGVR